MRGWGDSSIPVQCSSDNIPGTLATGVHWCCDTVTLQLMVSIFIVVLLRLSASTLQVMALSGRSRGQLPVDSHRSLGQHPSGVRLSSSELEAGGDLFQCPCACSQPSAVKRRRWFGGTEIYLVNICWAAMASHCKHCSGLDTKQKLPQLPLQVSGEHSAL